MKKIVLSLAGVMAAVAFAPEASAVPVFARQTGMACSSCHFQHFPALNGFGRAFKQAGYTLMGAQGKVEGEHLSIPDRLNMAVLATQGIDKASNSGSNVFVPGAGGELQLFFGGKVSDFAGFLSEFGTAAPAGAASAKLQLMPEVTPGVRAGVTLFSAGQGAAGSYEMLNTGATSIHRLMGKGGSTVAAGTGRANGVEHIATTSARQYVAPETNGGTGISFNVATENFVGSFAKSTDSKPGGIGGSQGKGLPFKYLRAVGLFDVAGWDTGVGIQSFSGTGSTTAAGAVAGTVVSYRATIIDAQMQGELSGMPAGFYASYGRAPGSSATGIENNFNPTVLVGGIKTATSTLTSFNIAGELGVIPGVSTVQVALRSAKTGLGFKDNSFMIGATYELAMNMEVGLHYTTQSGSAWNTVNNPTGVGKNVTTLLLETLF